MYRTPSRRRQLLVRVGIYSAMTVGVIILVTFLVFIMLGYRFNRDTSSIEQGGLVQFASRPADANVTIGSAKLSDQTPSKITVNPGRYDVSIARKGYKTWNKNVNVRAGEVLWLNYAQLAPETIRTDKVTDLTSVAGVKASPNGDRFAVLQDAAKPTLTFIDVTGDTPKQTTITVPDSLLPVDKTPTFALAEWANDSDRLLLNMTYDQTTERLLIDRRDADKSVNVSKSYQADIDEAIFDPRSSERLFIRSSSGDVRLVNTSDDSLSSVLATSATSMDLYGSDALLLVQSVDATSQSVGYMSLGTDSVRVIKRIQSLEPTHVAIAKYFNEPHIAVSIGNHLDILKVNSLPNSSSKDSISMSTLLSTDLSATVEHLSIRSSGRLVMAQYGSGVSTYDIELSKQTMTSFTSPVSEELRWLDKYHFYVTDGTDLEVMEFDGGNPRSITALATSFDAVQSDDGKFIYTLNSVDGGHYALQRSRMILE